MKGSVQCLATSPSGGWLTFVVMWHLSEQGKGGLFSAANWPPPSKCLSVAFQSESSTPGRIIRPECPSAGETGPLCPGECHSDSLLMFLKPRARGTDRGDRLHTCKINVLKWHLFGLINSKWESYVKLLCSNHVDDYSHLQTKPLLSSLQQHS